MFLRASRKNLSLSLIFKISACQDLRFDQFIRCNMNHSIANFSEGGPPLPHPLEFSAQCGLEGSKSRPGGSKIEIWRLPNRAPWRMVREDPEDLDWMHNMVWDVFRFLRDALNSA